MLGLSFDTLWQRYEREKAEEERKIKSTTEFNLNQEDINNNINYIEKEELD